MVAKHAFRDTRILIAQPLSGPMLKFGSGHSLPSKKPGSLAFTYAIHPCRKHPLKNPECPGCYAARVDRADVRGLVSAEQKRFI
jgi:hypothetical protein